MKTIPISLLLLTIALPGRAQTAMRVPATVTLAPMNDPWPAALDRWMDIDRNLYADWITNGMPNGKFSFFGNATEPVCH